jgi:hypothetical protein
MHKKKAVEMMTSWVAKVLLLAQPQAVVQELVALEVLQAALLLKEMAAQVTHGLQGMAWCVVVEEAPEL